jgi:hypothetical protein
MWQYDDLCQRLHIWCVLFPSSAFQLTPTEHLPEQILRWIIHTIQKALALCRFTLWNSAHTDLHSTHNLSFTYHLNVTSSIWNSFQTKKNVQWKSKYMKSAACQLTLHSALVWICTRFCYFLCFHWYFLQHTQFSFKLLWGSLICFWRLHVSFPEVKLMILICLVFQKCNPPF